MVKVTITHKVVFVNLPSENMNALGSYYIMLHIYILCLIYLIYFYIFNIYLYYNLYYLASNLVSYMFRKVFAGKNEILIHVVY